MPTNYTNYTPNDEIYIFCSPDFQGNPVTGSLTATPSGGTPGFDFDWGIYNPATQSYDPFQTDNNVPTSTISGLSSGGYKVTITDANGNTECYQTWVWVIQTTVNVAPIAQNCQPFNLSGSISGSNMFTYYDPPPAAFIIDQNTQISVCFSGNHTWVSDLGFFLIGPTSCGSPVLPLAPHPEAINSGNGCCCNNGDDVNNLCFSTSNSNMLQVCGGGTPLSGTYGIYGQGTPNNYNANQNDWSPIFGCDATQGGWTVQIWDCIALDVGSLTNATITFTGNSICGPSSITYNSGVINSAINDNSCTFNTASTYTVPFAPTATHTLTSTGTYEWTADPPLNIPNATSDLAPLIDPVPQTDTWFYLTVTESYGCVFKDSAFYDYVAPDATIDPAGPFCLSDQPVNLTAANTGGTWTGPGVTPAGVFDPAQAGPGTHTITYTLPGACGGSDTEDFIVNEVTATTTITDPLCNGTCDGEIDIVLNTGTPPVQYSIDNGNTSQATGNFTGLCAGTYDILIVDATNCQYTEQIVLTDPPVLSATEASTNATCGVCDGTITVTAQGGDGGPYQYSIDNGVNFQPSGNFIDVCPATYDIFVEDGLGCQATTSTTITQASGPSIVFVPALNTSCNGVCDGRIDIIATGATQYSIDGINFQASETFTGICPGTYDAIADDGNGCQVMQQVTVTEPPAISFSATVNFTLCNGSCDGSISISANGGSLPYQYSNDNGTSFQGGSTFLDLCAGTYDLVVMDANGCTSTKTENVLEPTALTLDLTTTDPTCNGDCDGDAAVNIGGGTAPYTYVWSTGETTLSAQNLCDGTYSVSVTDNNGCEINELNILITEPPAMAIDNITPTDEICFGDCSGMIEIDAPNATFFSIDGGATYSSSSIFTHLCDGDYQVMVQNNDGCKASGVTKLNPPIPVIVGFTANPTRTTEVEPLIEFTNESTGATQYHWTFGDGGEASETDVSYNYHNGVPGTYIACLEAFNDNGCIDSVCVTIVITEIFTLYVPNAFTPNNDGLNDEFFPVITGELENTFEMRIFNRWGEQLFFTHDKTNTWDGYIGINPAQEDVYIWKIYVEPNDGKDAKEYVGRVTLFR